MADADRRLVAAHEAGRQPVSQPIRGHPEHLDISRPKADLLTELAEHRLLEGLAEADTPLRELPSLAADTLAEEHAAAFLHQHDADVGAEAVAVDMVAHARVAWRLRRSSRYSRPCRISAVKATSSWASTARRSDSTARANASKDSAP